MAIVPANKIRHFQDIRYKDLFPLFYIIQLFWWLLWIYNTLYMAKETSALAGSASNPLRQPPCNPRLIHWWRGSGSGSNSHPFVALLRQRRSALITALTSRWRKRGELQCVQQPAPSELLGSERELGPLIKSLAVRCTEIGKLAVRCQRNFLIRQLVGI